MNQRPELNSVDEFLRRLRKTDPEILIWVRSLLEERDALRAALPDVDRLAQIIREVDGNHDLGAGALAEAIVARLTPPTTTHSLSNHSEDCVSWMYRVTRDATGDRDCICGIDG